MGKMFSGLIFYSNMNVDVNRVFAQKACNVNNLADEFSRLALSFYLNLLAQSNEKAQQVSVPMMGVSETFDVLLQKYNNFLIGRSFSQNKVVVIENKNVPKIPCNESFFKSLLFKLDEDLG